MGLVAVIMYRLLPSKAPVWAFARAQARNLARLCGVRVHVCGLENLRQELGGEDEIDLLIEFIARSKRGVIKR